MSSTNNLDREEPGARCSLNIRTNTGVKMIRQHPLLVNAHRNDEEGRLFEHRGREEDYESGRTVEFCVQGEYDIDDALSLMSRSSSVASISSFASDLKVLFTSLPLASLSTHPTVAIGDIDEWCTFM
ncbi:adenomatous polyposis coli protein [Caerostris extrusa]|uniref:Adenomatous polyposis coli protein n=1 Tax=Caerostris extrusa TaxID=172846 RepID=A0AAV4T991_CAEEX|nr:adenomatous polyposis coli protein [Caerostris extrusa]